jgi:NAD(P)-dependent dehydrogenase (short-subunit alcohol dehydrogenase family)
MVSQSSGSVMTGSRTVVITGGNSGLGYACAHAILHRPHGESWRVVLACRDPKRAKAAVDELTSGAGVEGQVEAMSLDLASLASVRAFAADLTRRLRTGLMPPLHALVCNAGVNPLGTKTETADGFESTFGINHLGHLLLVHELLPALQPPARIVVVASGVHDPAQKSGVPAPAWSDPVALARGELGAAAASDKELASGQRRYSTSKLANVYFTHALARRLPSGLTANAFDPGLMPRTGLMREAPVLLRWIARHIPISLLRRLFSPNVHTAEESGLALARLVTEPELSAVTGRYFEGDREIRSSAESYNDVRAEGLWNASLSLTAAGHPVPAPNVNRVQPG